MKLFKYLTLAVLFFALATGALAATDEAITPKQYDGIWFMGFNMAKDIFGDKNSLLVRKAFNMAIDRAWIAKNIVGDPAVPTGIIPPTMMGANTSLKGYPFDPALAKELMRKAGYPTSDMRLKQLTLLHTDGEKTVEIAKWIKRYLIKLGVDLQLVQVRFSDTASWARELKSGKYHMFLMGYKAELFNQIFIGDKNTKLFHALDCPRIPSAEAQEFFGGYDEAASAGYRPDEICKPVKKEEADASSILLPLFHSDGNVNFTFYSNSRVDSLLDQIEQMDKELKAARAAKLKEVDRLLLEDPPTVNIFYITKL